jgi:transposase
MVPAKLRAALHEARADVQRLRDDNAFLRKRCERLDAQVCGMQGRIDALEAQLEATRRAGKRQAAPFSKGPPRGDPKKPGRRPGAQYGTPAHREPPDHVDETVIVEVPDVCVCGGEVEAEGTAEQVQEDVPVAPRPVVTRFVVHLGRCRRCGRRIQGRHSRQTSDALGAAGAQLGPRAVALGSWLTKRMGLPARKAAQVMAEMTGIRVTAGGLVLATQRVGDRCEPAYDEIRCAVRQSQVVSPDETGWRIGGSNAWLWDFVTRDATAYTIDRSRGADVVKAMLGEDFAGVVVRDGWAPYRQLDHATHQTCVAHLRRRIEGILETAQGRAREIPLAVKGILLDALALRDRRDRRELDEAELAGGVSELEARMAALLARPCITRPSNRRLLKHLRHEQDALFTFLRRPDVEATNFRAEQAIRPAVVNRKVWGGNRTHRGAHTQAVLMSVMETCRQRKADAVAFLTDVQRGPLPLPPALPAGWANPRAPALASG